MCYSNGEWGDVDMSACTMRLGTFPLVMVETNSAEDDTLLMDEVSMSCLMHRYISNCALL